MRISLSQYVPLLATGSDGIQKLRGLILELAVRGKLVPQDTSDEPASELLNRITAERNQLAAKGIVKRSKLEPFNDEGACPFELPLGWKWARLGDVGLIGSSSRVHQKDWATDGVPFYRAREIVKLSANGSVRNELFIPEALYQVLSESGLTPSPGDLMVTGVGTIGVPYIVRQGDRFYFKDASVLIFKNYHRLCPEFVCAFMKSPYWVQRIHEKSMGTTVHTLTIARANEVLLPLPPLAEQHRIVAKVDELMALCDRLEAEQTDAASAQATLVETLLGTLTQSTDAADFAANWKRLSQNFDILFTSEFGIDALKRTVLQLAVMGKLVPQDHNDESASELLGRIAQERARLEEEGARKKAKPLLTVGKGEQPFTVPVNWTWVRLADICEAITSGSRDWAQHYSSDGAIFVRMGNLSRGSYQLRLNNIQYVNAPAGGEGTRTLLQSGDLLLSITGEVGLLGLIPDDFGEAYINQHTCMIRISPIMRGRFIPEVLRSPLALVQYNEPQRGIKNSFRLSDVAELLIPLPPLAEQQRIVTKIDELMVLCERLGADLAEARNRQARLASTLIESALKAV